MRNRFFWTALVVSLLAACQFDSESGEGVRCGADDSCPAGLGCYRGYCIAMAPCTDEGTARECFGEAASLVGVGACRAGEQVCEEGFLGPCLGQILPRTEICNLADDDCDGVVDEIAGMSCQTGRSGLCGQGELACRDGSAVCMALNMPSLETCNAEDDDCDGDVDESTAVVCYEAETGCEQQADGSYACKGLCAPGQQICTQGQNGDCEGAVVPAAQDGCTESGTAADDDCDGLIDEDCACALGAEQPCYGGPVGTDQTLPCKAGLQTCVMTEEGPRFGDCVGQQPPVPETCVNDGSDDNCDGTPDNVPMRNTSCIDDSKQGACQIGALRCASDVLTCVTPTPVVETCDGVDDDCDGPIDEDFMFATDPLHCGGCGMSCGEGLNCCGGCSDIDTDELNCGACGERCGEGLECCSRACVDIDKDPLNCGACGNACGEGQTCCDGACIDTRSDSLNCGVCGKACADGTMCCGGTCAAATAPACTGCAEDCSLSGKLCCNGSCVDPARDESHCGGCGSPCGDGQVCCDGCVSSNTMHCGQSCGACEPGQLCCEGGCVPSNGANCTACGNACASGSSCCPDGCKDLQNDSASCGTCGKSCANGEACSAGHCCPIGRAWCAQVNDCVDLQENNSHCGACGNACVGSGLGICACNEGDCTGLCLGG